jgi:hypothetical protein
MADHPMKVLLRTAAWHQLVRTVCWIRDHTAEAVYLREIDVPGVDTKFIETNKAILAELLDHTLPEDRIDASAPKSDLAARYGFRTKPVYRRWAHRFREDEALHARPVDGHAESGTEDRP